MAKLHLYTMTIVRVQSRTTSRNKILRLGFAAALLIICLLDSGLGYTSNTYQDLPKMPFKRALPKVYFRSLALAAVFLRYFALNSRAAEDQELARNHVTMATRLLQTGIY
ncbi:hypothetical protein K469DRAFT_781325, partial [Zopfia rhizophila CBS 207.26]